MKRGVQILLIMCVTMASISCAKSKHGNITNREIAQNLVGQNISVGTSGWTFGKDEPIEVSIIDIKKNASNPDVITLKANVKTEGRWSHLKMAGDLQAEYRWSNNTWIIGQISNISFRPKGNDNLEQGDYQPIN